MPGGTGERRLAAILAADVAGYSRLMGIDEEGTLARITGHLRAQPYGLYTGAGARPPASTVQSLRPR